MTAATATAIPEATTARTLAETSSRRRSSRRASASTMTPAMNSGSETCAYMRAASSQPSWCWANWLALSARRTSGDIRPRLVAPCERIVKRSPFVQGQRPCSSKYLRCASSRSRSRSLCRLRRIKALASTTRPATPIRKTPAPLAISPPRTISTTPANAVATGRTSRTQSRSVRSLFVEHQLLGQPRELHGLAVHGHDGIERRLLARGDDPEAVVLLGEEVFEARERRIAGVERQVLGQAPEELRQDHGLVRQRGER